MKILLLLASLFSLHCFAQTNVILYHGDYKGDFDKRANMPKTYVEKVKNQLELNGYKVIEVVDTQGAMSDSCGMDEELSNLAFHHDAQVVKFLTAIPYTTKENGSVNETACAIKLEMHEGNFFEGTKLGKWASLSDYLCKNTLTKILAKLPKAPKN